MKIYLVSDATKFALTDIYAGYQNALKNLKIPFEVFPYHNVREFFADPLCMHLIHSDILQKDKGITHAMFIGGLSIPDYIFESLYHVKSVVVSTEDPHSFDPNKNRLGKIDYYFTNERSIAKLGKFKNVYYCPTAGCSEECGKFPIQALDKKYHSDILFLGALYPNRRKLLEAIIPFVKRNKLSFKICGHVQYMPKSSPLWEYVFDARTVPHDETVKYYNGAKIVLNMLRDVTWNPRTKSGKNPLNRGRFKAESLNPRAYEVPLCQAFMLLEDTRPEARDIFTEKEVGFFSDESELVSRLNYFLNGKGKDKREEMAFAAYKKVSLNHTYLRRFLSIKNVLEKSSDPT